MPFLQVLGSLGTDTSVIDELQIVCQIVRGESSSRTRAVGAILYARWDLLVILSFLHLLVPVVQRNMKQDGRCVQYGVSLDMKPT